MSMDDREYDLPPEDIRDTIPDAGRQPGENTGLPADDGGLMPDSPAGQQPLPGECAAGLGADDGQQEPCTEQDSGLCEGERQPVADEVGEHQQLRGELAAVSAQRDTLLAQCETLRAESERLRHDCTRLEDEAEKLRSERDRLLVSELDRMGAVDGGYLLERLRKEGVTDCEQICKQAKARFPQLFLRRLDGVRPAGGGNGEAAAPGERSFSERMQLFAQDPDGYAAQYTR